MPGMSPCLAGQAPGASLFPPPPGSGEHDHRLQEIKYHSLEDLVLAFPVPQEVDPNTHEHLVHIKGAHHWGKDRSSVNGVGTIGDSPGKY